jgi:hypothetical protein
VIVPVPGFHFVFAGKVLTRPGEWWHFQIQDALDAKPDNTLCYLLGFSGIPGSGFVTAGCQSALTADKNREEVSSANLG